MSIGRHMRINQECIFIGEILETYAELNAANKKEKNASHIIQHSAS